MCAEPTVKINRQQLNIQLSANGLLQTKAKDYVNKNFFIPAVKEMKQQFEQHPITQEIEGGIEADNISNTLKGDFPSDEGKNLFSFIGFQNGDTPIDDIRYYLDPVNPSGPKLKLTNINKGKLQYTFEVTPPSLEEIHKNTPMPWADGLSWVKRIETGIPNLGKFLNKIGIKGSRSGGGIQVKKSLRDGKYAPRSYMTQIINKFIKRATAKPE